MDTLPVRLSVLDRSRTRQGEDHGEALRATVDRAARTEALGHHRFRVAEHHAVPGIASGSPPVLIAGCPSSSAVPRCRIVKAAMTMALQDRSPTTKQARTIERTIDGAVYGTPAQVRQELADLIERTGAAEVLASTSTYDREDLARADAALAELFAGE